MSKKLKGTPDRVWLAGLGALAIAEQEGNDLFQQLVEKGKEIERTIGPPKPSRPNALRTRSSVRQDREAIRQILRDERGALKEKRKALKRNLYLAKPPEPPDLKTVEARQARRLESAKRAFLKEFGSPAKPPECERLLQERKIFALSRRNAVHIPSFQFDEKGHPRPAVAKVIQILGPELSDWGLALWFTAVNGWLGDKRPVDLLADEPEQVVQAAEQEAAELVF